MSVKTPSLRSENPTQQVFEIYNKDLSQLESELQNLITKKETLLKDKSPSKKQLRAINEKISETKREILKKKHQYKLAGLEQEKDNREYLIAIQSDKEWSKFAYNSAVFFMIDIQPRLKNSNRFHLYPDADNYGYSIYGVVSLKLDDALLAEFKNLKITEEKSEIEGLRKFKLPWKYSDKRFEKITTEIEKNLGKLDVILTPQNISPQLFKQIEDLEKATYYIAKSISEPLAKNSLGKALFAHSTNLSLEYFNLTNGKTDPQKSCAKILAELEIFGYFLKTLLDLNLVKYHDGLRLGGLIVQVRNAVKSTLNGAKNAKNQQ